MQVFWLCLMLVWILVLTELFSCIWAPTYIYLTTQYFMHKNLTKCLVGNILYSNVFNWTFLEDFNHSFSNHLTSDYSVYLFLYIIIIFLASFFLCHLFFSFLFSLSSLHCFLLLLLAKKSQSNKTLLEYFFSTVNR